MPYVTYTTRIMKSLNLLIFLALILPVSNSFSQTQKTPQFHPLGETTIQHETLVFGGSFSPPTLEHMGIVSRIMTRFGFRNAKMMVALPYKAGAAPASVSLGLTKTAVEHFDEVLEISGTDFKNFRSEEGAAHWTGKAGTVFKVEVDDFEIRTENRANTLKTLAHLHAQSKSARSNYWISGGDSFSSIPTWTPQWKELFDHVNWIVVSRPGFDQGEKDIKFYQDNPLKAVLGEDFIAQYNYHFDEAHQIHAYTHQDPEKPGIFILNQPVLDDSSSKNRKSLAEEIGHHHAQAGLQPSVFKECVQQGYYSNERQSSDYRVFTQKNLETYLRWLFKRIERNAEDRLSPAVMKDFHEMSRVLIDTASDLTLAQNNPHAQNHGPWVIALVGHVYENIGALLSDPSQIQKISKKIRATANQYRAGEFAAVYIALQIAESLALPSLSYLSELIAVPAFLSWNVMTKYRHKIRLAGDHALYRQLTDYRNRLTRGDPDAIVSRVELKKALGLHGSQPVLNIVKSRLPKWIPHAVRKWDDRRVTWHDLNISTNELQGALANDSLASRLQAASGGDHGLYGNLLLTAVLENPHKRISFELFITHRYFKRFYLGDVPEELVLSLTAEERNALESLKKYSEGITRSLPASSLNQLADVVSFYYAVSRLVQIEPQLIQESGFWVTLINLMATGYPGKKASEANIRALRQAGSPFSLMKKGLKSQFPNLFKNSMFFFLSERDPSRKVAIEVLRYEEAVAGYLEKNRSAFVLPQAWSYQPHEGFEILPTRTLLADRSHLVWEMQLLQSDMDRQFKVLESAFDRASLYLADRPKHPRSQAAFADALVQSKNRLRALQDQLTQLEYQWLKVKYTYELSPLAQTEIKLPGYAEVSKQVESLRNEMNQTLDGVRTLIHMMFGSVIVPLQDIDPLKSALNEAINPRTLGRGIEAELSQILGSAQYSFDPSKRVLYFNRFSITPDRDRDQIYSEIVQSALKDKNAGSVLVMDFNASHEPMLAQNIFDGNHPEIVQNKTYHELTQTEKDLLFNDFFHRVLNQIKSTGRAYVVIDHHFPLKALSDTSTTILLLDLLEWVYRVKIAGIIQNAEAKSFIQVFTDGFAIRDHADADIVLSNWVARNASNPHLLQTQGWLLRKTVLFNDYIELPLDASTLERSQILWFYAVLDSIEHQIQNQELTYERSFDIVSEALSLLDRLSKEKNAQTDILKLSVKAAKAGTSEKELQILARVHTYQEALTQKYLKIENVFLNLRTTKNLSAESFDPGKVIVDDAFIVAFLPEDSTEIHASKVYQYLIERRPDLSSGRKALIAMLPETDGSYHIKMRAFSPDVSFDRVYPDLKTRGLKRLGGRSRAGTACVSAQGASQAKDDILKVLSSLRANLSEAGSQCGELLQ